MLKACSLSRQVFDLVPVHHHDRRAKRWLAEFFHGLRGIAPGHPIAAHRHHHMDEIHFIHRGSGLASLGTREAAVTAGTTIYIQSDPRVSLRNTGTEPLSIPFIFPPPEAVHSFREASVPEGERAMPFSADEFAALRARHQAHVIFDKP